jgi:hypothetical protein
MGYDPGLYLFLWKHDLSIPWLKQGFPPVIFLTGQAVAWLTNPENIVVPMSLIVATVLFVAVYLYTKNKWTMIILATSAIQYRLWWWYYLKQILATAGIFFYLYFDKKKSKWAYLPVALVVWTHQPTAIILFIVLLLQKNIRAIGVFILAFSFYYLPTFKETVLPFIGAATKTIGAGESGSCGAPD